MIDFSYHGEKLSDYGCIVTGIHTDSPGSVQVSVPLRLDTIKTSRTYTHKIVNAKYDDVITAAFDICRNPLLYRTEQEMAFSDSEISHFVRWLNQKQYCKFKPIYENNMYSDLYFYGTFTSISKIIWNGCVVGLTLTFTSNSPFGYVDDKEFTVSLKTANETFLFFDDSDEIGCLYPYFFQVECLADGKLLIENDRESKNTVVDNCVHGEIITMDCGSRIIQSSMAHSTLYNDFNYNYPRIINDYENRRNLFTVSIPCNITIKYAPIRKAGIIV